MNSFLPFHGTEADYLRAQIARISSATHIAPEGFYNRLGEGEDDDDLGWQYRIEENETYTERPVSELTLDNWVHSAPYILPQGRATWHVFVILFWLKDKAVFALKAMFEF